MKNTLNTYLSEIGLLSRALRCIQQVALPETRRTWTRIKTLQKYSVQTEGARVYKCAHSVVLTPFS
jgi:hypothetical protein